MALAVDDGFQVLGTRRASAQTLVLDERGRAARYTERYRPASKIALLNTGESLLRY